MDINQLPSLDGHFGIWKPLDSPWTVFGQPLDTFEGKDGHHGIVMGETGAPSGLCPTYHPRKDKDRVQATTPILIQIRGTPYWGYVFTSVSRTTGKFTSKKALVSFDELVSLSIYII